MCRIYVMFLVAFVCVCDCKCHGTLVYGIRYAVHIYIKYMLRFRKHCGNSKLIAGVGLFQCVFVCVPIRNP